MTIKRRHQAGAGVGGPGKPTSKADLAYESILLSIRGGDFAPGDRLVFERLARWLGMSVVPVREAIRRLEADGLVTFTRNIGATVTSIDQDGRAETLETVASLEGIAMGLAAPHLTPARLGRARTVNERLRSTLSPFDPTRFRHLDRRFHDVLLDACPNGHLVTVLARERALLDAAGGVSLDTVQRAARCVDEHEVVLGLIERAGDHDLIERWARDHRLRGHGSSEMRTVDASPSEGSGADRQR